MFLVPSETFFFFQDVVTTGDGVDFFLWMISDFLVQPLPRYPGLHNKPQLLPLLFGPVSYFDTSQVNNFYYLSLEEDFNEDISRWDVSNVKSMENLFWHCSLFNQPLGNWDVSNVTNMEQMFYYATSFNQPLGNWNVSKVTSMHRMFENATAFNQSLSEWNFTKRCCYFFMMEGATSFTNNYDSWKKKVDATFECSE
jgi:surface protein